MRVTKTLIDNATIVEDLGNTSYFIDGNYVSLRDLPFNAHGQTTAQVCSFTFALAHLLSVSYLGKRPTPFATAISDEAFSYIDTHAVDEYLAHLRLAAEYGNLALPDDFPSGGRSTT